MSWGHDSREDRPSSAPTPWSPDEASSPAAPASDRGEKENHPPPVASAKPSASPQPVSDPDRAPRAHFKPAQDILLLKSVLAFQAHLRGVNGPQSGKWHAIEGDVVRAVRAQLKMPLWDACARTMQERFNRLLADHRARQLREVRARAAPAGVARTAPPTPTPPASRPPR